MNTILRRCGVSALPHRLTYLILTYLLSDNACTQRDQLKTLYQPGDGSDHASNRDALDKVSGDRAFTCPTIDLNNAFDQAGVRTYFYYLTHRASNEVWPPWMGVIHGAEIQV